MALKTDLSKAFDNLERNFIKDTLLSINIPSNIVNLILSCICTPYISLLWNGEITNSFSPSKGIRQGHPLSPYIFVLCLDRLSKMIQDKVNSGDWKPMKIAKDINISHLLYADDVFLFGKSDSSNIQVMMDVLDYFKQISGLSINILKSPAIDLS